MAQVLGRQVGGGEGGGQRRGKKKNLAQNFILNRNQMLVTLKSNNFFKDLSQKKQWK